MVYNSALISSDAPQTRPFYSILARFERITTNPLIINNYEAHLAGPRSCREIGMRLPNEQHNAESEQEWLNRRLVRFRQLVKDNRDCEGPKEQENAKNNPLFDRLREMGVIENDAVFDLCVAYIAPRRS